MREIYISHHHASEISGRYCQNLGSRRAAGNAYRLLELIMLESWKQESSRACIWVVYNTAKIREAGEQQGVQVGT